jgi:hypothetical protein
MKLALSQIRTDTLGAPCPSMDPKTDFPAFPELVAGVEYSSVTSPGVGPLGVAWIRPADGGLFHCEAFVEGATFRSRHPMHGSIVPYWFRLRGLEPNRLNSWSVNGVQAPATSPALEQQEDQAGAEVREGDCVYMIQQGADGPIKIGFSSDIRARISGLQTANPYPLRLLKTIPGNELLERKLHSRFAKHRLVGEWFKPEADLLAFAAEVRQ